MHPSIGSRSVHTHTRIYIYERGSEIYVCAQATSVDFSKTRERVEFRMMNRCCEKREERRGFIRAVRQNAKWIRVCMYVRKAVLDTRCFVCFEIGDRESRVFEKASKRRRFCR